MNTKKRTITASTNRNTDFGHTTQHHNIAREKSKQTSQQVATSRIRSVLLLLKTKYFIFLFFFLK